MEDGLKGKALAEYADSLASLEAELMETWHVLEFIDSAVHSLASLEAELMETQLPGRILASRMRSCSLASLEAELMETQAPLRRICNPDFLV